MIRFVWCKLTGTERESFGASSGMMDAGIDFGVLAIIVAACKFIY